MKDFFLGKKKSLSYCLPRQQKPVQHTMKKKMLRDPTLTTCHLCKTIAICKQNNSSMLEVYERKCGL
jgi:hypothetical protein